MDDEELFAYLPLEDSILELLKKFAEVSDDDKKEKLKLFRVMMSLMALMRMWARRRHDFRGIAVVSIAVHVLIAQLVGMGYPTDKARRGLRRSGWDVSAAVERIENGGAEK